ncbi:hypothetical protein FOCC_FOCC014073 [Frankliniella occidentalis]|nr:hypothetical protein FOCC_FOCC014073 [Frankliniella occidentalis]
MKFSWGVLWAFVVAICVAYVQSAPASGGSGSPPKSNPPAFSGHSPRGTNPPAKSKFPVSYAKIGAGGGKDPNRPNKQKGNRPH